MKKPTVDQAQIVSEPAKGAQKGAGKLKGITKGKAKGKPKAKAAANPKGQKRKINTLSIKANKCIRFNLGSCPNAAADCNYSHECAICGDPACAADWHDL